MPLPGRNALSPWQGLPIETRPLPVPVGSCLPGGAGMWEGALRGPCPREGPPLLLCFPLLGKK